MAFVAFASLLFVVYGAKKHPTLKDSSEATCLRCHKDIKSGKAVHSLFEVASCDTCHESAVEDDKTVMKLSASGVELCTMCHSDIEKAMGTGKDTHGVIETAGCTACHNPHSAPYKKLLSYEGNELCISCHTSQGKEKKHPHAAIEMMECKDCHSPHGSSEKALLLSSVIDTCEGCHDISDSAFQKKHNSQPVAKTGCTYCHEPHGSSQKKILKGKNLHEPFVGGCDGCHDSQAEGKITLNEEVPELCYMCHSGIEDLVEGSKYPHGAMEMGCISCHDPHQSNNKALLFHSEVETCGDCHDIEGSDFRKTHKSQPVKQSGCSACHNPHASDEPKLLKGVSMHKPFMEGDCYGCHISAKGDKALIKKSGDKLCLSCHKDIMKGSVKHDAIEAVNCQGCHGYHQSDNVSLLLENPTDSCTMCHDLTDIKSQHGDIEMKNAVCSGCHNPHSSDSDKLLKKGFIHEPFGEGSCFACHDMPMDEVKDACLMCHDGIEKNLSAGYPHAAIEMAGCQSCHEPHISPVEKQLKGDNVIICGECHDLSDKSYLEKHANQPISIVDCTSCHDPHGSNEEHIFKGNNYHMPFEEKMCDACHVDSEIEIGLAEKGNTLCFGCHSDQEEELQKKNLHSAFSDGNCVDCHDPHLDKAAKLLPVKGQEFCFSCHSEIKKAVNAKHGHAALDMMECTDCHHPHASDNIMNLTSGYPSICSDCHDTSDADLKKKHFNVDMDKLKCGECHNPHGSENAKLLKGFTHSPFADGMCDACHPGAENGVIQIAEDGSDELCFMCHDGKKTEIEGYAVKHGALEMGSCTVCHDPHASETKNLLVGDMITTCTECHSEVGDVLKEKSHPHGIIADYGCAACHKPHGSENVSILKKTVNDTCLECHLKVDEKGDDTPVSEVVLFSEMRVPKGYYDGMDKLRLTKNKEKGHPTTGHPVYKEENKFDKEKKEFNCVSCHDPHGEDNPDGLKGDFQNRISFCATCHSEK